MLASVESFIDRLTGKRLWSGHEKTLKQRDLFILPNRFGIYVGFLVFASFAMGYRVQNNFILLGVIFLFLIFMLSLIASVRNLQGLSFSFRTAPYYLASETQHVMLSLQRPDPAYNLELHLPTSDKLVLNLPKGQAEIRPAIGRLPRGVHTIPKLKVQTRFPFGIVRCWSWLSPSLSMTVCPTPDMKPLSAYPRSSQRPARDGLDDFSTQMPPQASPQTDDGSLQDPRIFEDGDLPSRIDWKRFAATRELLTRDFSPPDTGDVLLQAPANMEKEAALSYLCGGLLVCASHRENAVMIFGAQRFTIHNETQRLEALHALARA